MQGLSGQQVSESKAKYGTNELAKKETESLWSMFIGAFDDIWIKVLCAALALKVILAVLGIFVPALSGGNDVVEIISIVIAIALATGFSTLSEYRNTSRSEALQEEYSKTYAKVVRDGKLVNILSKFIFPIVADHTVKFRLTVFVDNVSRRHFLSLIHSHIKRRIHPIRKSAFGGIKLV